MIKHILCRLRNQFASNFSKSILIVWVATSFKEQHLNEIMQNSIYCINKNIEFVALKLNGRDIISIMEEINSSDTFKQIGMLERLHKVERRYELVRGVKIYNSENIVDSKIVDKNETYSYKQQYLIEIIKYLRYHFKEFVNIHQLKM